MMAPSLDTSSSDSRASETITTKLHLTDWLVAEVNSDAKMLLLSIMIRDEASHQRCPKADCTYFATNAATNQSKLRLIGKRAPR